MTTTTQRRAITAATIFAALFFVASAPHAQNAATSSAGEDAIKKEIQQMQWHNNTTVTLQESHGRLVIPEGYSAILGHDAQRMDAIINGKTSANGPKSEASVFSSDLKAQTDFDFVQSGYVSEDDVDTLNPTELLKSVSDLTEEQNKERRAEGLSELHVVKWLHQPVYDKTSHTAFWAIEATDSSGGDVANSTALRLGRAGFERLTLITEARDYTPVGSPLDLMLRAFAFSPGDTYEEHLTTDKAAGYGIAALIGAVVGAKVVKVAAAGGLALFFKPILAFLAVLLSKAWLLLLAPFIWLKSIIRKFRGRKRQQPKPQSPPDDETKAAFANAIAALLDVQLTLLSPEDKRIEDQQGNIFRKSIGYIYGFIDAFLRTRGYDMANIDIGMPVTFHVFRKLFPSADADRYIDFLMHNMNDEQVALGTLHGGQQWLDFSKPEAKGAPMGLFRFMLEDKALRAAA